MFPLSPRFLILRSPLSLPSRHPLFYVSRFIAFSFRIGFLWCLSVLDYGFGMFVFGIAFMAAVYRHSSRPASILAALSPSPKRHLRRRLLLFVSLSSPSLVVVVFFSVVPLRRFHLGISTLASASALQSLVLIRRCFRRWSLAWNLDRRREVLS